jgi:hypothetical protein
MKLILLLPFFIFLFDFNSYHQIKGTIVDHTTNENLAGVSININNKIIYTDLDGNFSTIVKKGHYILETNYISYENIKNEIEIKKDTNLKINVFPQSNI